MLTGRPGKAHVDVDKQDSVRTDILGSKCCIFMFKYVLGSKVHHGKAKMTEYYASHTKTHTLLP